MKLLTKTSLLIVTASVFIFWIGNIAFFFISREMISQHINSELLSQKLRIESLFEEQESPDRLQGISDEISVREVSAIPSKFKSLSDTVIFNTNQQEYIPYRAMRFYVDSGQKVFEISIYKSLLSSDKLIRRITLSSVVLLIVFIIVIFILNRYIFNKVWSDFSYSMRRVEDFDIKSEKPLELHDSEIEEFRRLNRVLHEMVNRIQSDYKNLKDLTANTSHEIQTPLAIIRNKAEMLLQSDKLGEKDIKIIHSILETTGRLSKLNQSLLLIARIENKQFEDSDNINLKKEVENHLNGLEAMVVGGNYKISGIRENTIVQINKTLLDVLITNLLRNALLHGNPAGDINIGLSSMVLIISNEGSPLDFPQEEIFTRFVKGKKGNSGIGLEIVSRICEYYNIPLSYDYHDSRHIFSIDFARIRSTETKI